MHPGWAARTNDRDAFLTDSQRVPICVRARSAEALRGMRGERVCELLSPPVTTPLLAGPNLLNGLHEAINLLVNSIEDYRTR